MAVVLVALHAGCVERVPPGFRLGLDGTLFSPYPVNITSIILPPTYNNRLSSGGIISITVITGVCLVIFGVAITYTHRQRTQYNTTLEKQNTSNVEEGLSIIPLQDLSHNS